MEGEMNILMKLKDLANYCRSIEIDCDKCEYTNVCRNLQDDLEDISPSGLVKMVEENYDIKPY